MAKMNIDLADLTYDYLGLFLVAIHVILNVILFFVSAKASSKVFLVISTIVCIAIGTCIALPMYHGISSKSNILKRKPSGESPAAANK